MCNDCRNAFSEDIEMNDQKSVEGGQKGLPHGEKRKRISSSSMPNTNGKEVQSHQPPTAAEIREGLLSLEKSKKEGLQNATMQAVKVEESDAPRPENHTQTYEQTEITEAIRKRAGGQACERLCKVLPKLRVAIPEAEQTELLEAIREYLNEKLDPEAFAEHLKLLVDKHQIVLPNDDADIPKGPRCIWLPPTTPDGRARRATPSLVHSMHLMQQQYSMHSVPGAPSVYPPQQRYASISCLIFLTAF